ncbi:SDR family NAD(P)-dependent oxidoreductase [Streptomyces sp. NPDC048161]|uniref:SDR family NAD(P)-dependent oxidoreductase n=1 Tax=Streptomyces sp. NPDC048161 TaxID=3160985 RepID=UPI0034102EEC
MARAFGRRGFKVGLIARTRVRLEDLVAELAGLGVTAAAFPADIRDHESLTAALAAAESAMGPIDVLEFSPSPTGPITRAAGTTVASATAQFELHVRGAVAAVRYVLPDMRDRGNGTLLLTTGVSSMIPAPFLANVGRAMSGLRNWAHALHTELGPEGIYVGTVTIASGIVPGDGETDPDAIGPGTTRCTSSGTVPKRSSETRAPSKPSPTSRSAWRRRLTSVRGECLGTFG